MSGYLVLEGADGCGKSTQAAALRDWLESEGCSTLHVREPGSTPVGEALRQILLSPSTGSMRAISEALLFFAARAELVADVIVPGLADDRVVVAERCYLSTVVYQGYAGDGSVDVDWLFDLAARVHGPHLPDRIFVLDVDAEVASRRRSARTADRFETRDRDYHERVRSGFRAASERDERIRLVDAAGPFHAVQDELRRLAVEALR